VKLLVKFQSVSGQRRRHIVWTGNVRSNLIKSQVLTSISIISTAVTVYKRNSFNAENKVLEWLQ
jgi:hypothetical protein